MPCNYNVSNSALTSRWRVVAYGPASLPLAPSCGRIRVPALFIYHYHCFLIKAPVAFFTTCPVVHLSHTARKREFGTVCITKNRNNKEVASLSSFHQNLTRIPCTAEFFNSKRYQINLPRQVPLIIGTNDITSSLKVVPAILVLVLVVTLTPSRSEYTLQ